MRRNGCSSVDAPVSGGTAGAKAATLTFMIGVCEAFVLAQRLGLSAQALFDVASVSSGQCWSLTNYCPVPVPVPLANSGYKGGFATALMLKDLRLAGEAAKAAGATMQLGAHAAERFARFNALGHGGDDFSGIFRMLRHENQGTA